MVCVLVNYVSEDCTECSLPKCNTAVPLLFLPIDGCGQKWNELTGTSNYWNMLTGTLRNLQGHGKCQTCAGCAN